VPDLVVEQGPRVWIIDAKYKGHFEELDDHRWAELGEELQSEHRHDVHQALAYAATRDTAQITTVLAYPMRLTTWQRLADRNRKITTATITTGSREVRLALVGVPIQTMVTVSARELIQPWEALLSRTPA
jgi:5-methylcytosine-specific restriction endonuclease McrBC regulatory subunit McrC